MPKKGKTKKGGKPKAPKNDVNIALTKRQIVASIHKEQLEEEHAALEKENRLLEESTLGARSAHKKQVERLLGEMARTEDSFKEGAHSLKVLHEEKLEMQRKFDSELGIHGRNLSDALGMSTLQNRQWADSKKPLEEVRSKHDNMKAHIESLWAELHRIKTELTQVDSSIMHHRRQMEVDCKLTALPKASDLFDKRQVGRHRGTDSGTRSNHRRQSRTSIHGGLQVSSAFALKQSHSSASLVRDDRLARERREHMGVELTPLPHSNSFPAIITGERNTSRTRSDSHAEFEAKLAPAPAAPESDDHFAEFEQILQKKENEYNSSETFCLPLLIVRIVAKLHRHKIAEGDPPKDSQNKSRARRSRIVRNLPKNFSSSMSTLVMNAPINHSERTAPTSKMDRILLGLFSALDSMILSSLEDGTCDMLQAGSTVDVILLIMNESFSPDVQRAGTKVIWKMLGNVDANAFMLELGLSHMMKILDTFTFSPCVNPIIVECMHSLLPLAYLDAMQTHGGDDEFDAILYNDRGPGLARLRRNAIQPVKGEECTEIKPPPSASHHGFNMSILDPYVSHDYRKNANNPDAAGVLGGEAHGVGRRRSQSNGAEGPRRNKKVDAKDEVNMHVLRTRVQTMKALALKAMAFQAGESGLIDHKVSDLNINRVVRMIFAALMYCTQETRRYESEKAENVKKEKAEKEKALHEKDANEKAPQPQTQQGDEDKKYTLKETHAMTCHFLCDILVKLIVKDSAFYVIDVINHPKRLIVLMKVLDTFLDCLPLVVSCTRCWCFLLTSNSISKEMVSEMGLPNVIRLGLKQNHKDENKTLMSVAAPVMEFFGQSNLARRTYALEKSQNARDYPNLDAAHAIPASFTEEDELAFLKSPSPQAEKRSLSKSGSVPWVGHEKKGLNRSNLMSQSAMFPALSPLA
jgi:hypothetical protein